MPAGHALRFRIPLLILAFTCLLLGIAGGLWRLGWNLAPAPVESAGLHGPLMVCGFLGTLISLERAVALRKNWAMLAPLFAGAGALALLTEAPATASIGLLTLASAILTLASFNIYFHHRALFTLTLLLGSACWLVGNASWLGGLPIMQVTPWWIGFLVLTIAGERLELSRMRPLSTASRAMFMVITALLLTSMAAASLAAPLDVVLLSVLLITLALWLFQHDIARVTIRQTGLPRYIAVCLLSGYVWLLVAGAIGLMSPVLMPGSGYDAFLHAIFVGFVFSMIFGHAPVIFTALAKVKVPYHPVFYVPLIMLHISLLARIAGDLLPIPHCRLAGGTLNAAALALFILVIAVSVMRGRHQPQPLHSSS